MDTRRLLRLPLLLVLCAAPARSQEESLAEHVERYLSHQHDHSAQEVLDGLLARDDADPEALLERVRACDRPVKSVMTDTFPYEDVLLTLTVCVPDGHSRDAARLPVVLDVSRGTFRDFHLKGGVICCYIEGYTPPEFSDEGRDVFTKALRRAAWLGHGDPDQLWMSGYSWAAHASYDTAFHRPGVLRGIFTWGGGPRRLFFRLLPNLEGTQVISLCGELDDPELVWNLRELEHYHEDCGFDYALTLDPEQGHNWPIRGWESGHPRIRELATAERERPDAGSLLADGDFVESPLIRILEVVPGKVKPPERITVKPGLSRDELRRATIAPTLKRVASVEWSVRRRKTSTTVTLKPRSVKRYTVFLRTPDFELGEKVTVKAGTKTLLKGPLEIDPRVLLEEARRTGERLRPAVWRGGDAD